MSTYVIAIQNRQPAGNPLLYSEFLSTHPDCLVQESPTNDIIGPYGFEVFQFSSTPTFGTFEHQPIRKNVYICREDGIWTDTWEIIPFTEQEIADKIQEGWVHFRIKRNMYLRVTDWTQIADVTLNQNDLTTWRTYRQTLRDLPAAVTDPFDDSVWPVPPAPLFISSSIPFRP